MERIKRALDEAREQREGLQLLSVAHTTAGPPNGAVTETSRSPDQRRGMRDATIWLAIVAGVIIIGVLVWMISSKNQGLSISLSALEDAADTSRASAAKLTSYNTIVSELLERQTSLQARVDSLESAIVRMQESIPDVHARTNSVVASTDAATVDKKEAETQLVLAEEQSAATVEEADEPVPATNNTYKEAAIELPPAEQASAAATRDGPWVINVASFSDKRDADRFAMRAQSRNIHVQKKRVTVKDKSYWRVQVPGFLSTEDAKTHAASIEATLGLTESWISRN